MQAARVNPNAICLTSLIISYGSLNADGASASARVRLVVTPVNDAPTMERASGWGVVVVPTGREVEINDLVKVRLPNNTECCAR